MFSFRKKMQSQQNEVHSPSELILISKENKVEIEERQFKRDINYIYKEMNSAAKRGNFSCTIDGISLDSPIKNYGNLIKYFEEVGFKIITIPSNSGLIFSILKFCWGDEGNV